MNHGPAIPDVLPDENAVLIALRDQAEQALQRARAPLPEHAGTSIDAAEQALVRLRDALIERYRIAPELRARLDQVNVAISLVVGIEAPITARQRQRLESALSVIGERRGETT